ncbi:MAG: hypothetical protein E2O39_13865 [Planctomycetota bacterium]|nr:MAG: hypothetical protein E2O39_13865 [Planctomycetota bacterium]
MFESFVHPALAFGATLAAVPLIIHLLNRQRHKPMHWAAMRFVLAAYRKTRRRVQFENLLLLLLRMAAVALLALAVARPFAAGDSPFAALTEDRRDVVLVIDGSASTGYREDVETVFERIVERASEIVSRLDGARGDRVWLIWAGDRPRLLSWTSPDKALTVLSNMTRPLDEGLDLAAALGAVKDIVEQDAAGTGQSALEVRLFTDMQRRVFEPDDVVDAAVGGHEPAAPILIEQLDALAAFGTKVLVEDLGPAPEVPGNLGIAAVGPSQPIIGPGVPVEIVVTVANYGSTPRAAVRVALEVDGERQPSQRIDIAARATQEAVFTLQLDSPGAHALTARLEGDRLAADDQRAHVVFVPAPIRILVVNGASDPDIEDDETGYLMAVLEPPDDSHLPGLGGLSPFDPREITPSVLADPELDLTDYEVIVIANVSNVSDAVILRLEERVDAGATLIVTAGDHFGRTIAGKLFRADGTGLLPAEVTRPTPVAAAGDDYYRVASFEEDHPILSFFSEDLFRPLLTEVPIYRFMQTRPLPIARVIARLDDEAQSPLLIERTYGGGRVIFWTTTIDRAWTRLPESPNTLIPFVHELIRYAGRRRVPSRNVGPGTPVTIEVDDVFPRSPVLVSADGEQRPIDGAADEFRKNRWRLPTIPGRDTERAGLYRVELEGALPEPFAVQLDPGEGDLARLAPAAAAALHPAFVPLARGETERGGDDDQPRRGEIWRWLALGALLALTGESLWAGWLGHKRRIVA